MVISYGAWQREFGGDTAIVGRRVTDAWASQTFTIVGVASPGLDYPAGVGYWIPIPVIGGTATVVARLAPDASPAAARTELALFAQRVHPESHFTGASAFTFPQAVLGEVRPVLVVLLGAVGLLLLLTCVNVGNLLLLRAATRARELGIRRALGANYADVVRHLLTESGALAVAGGVLGIVCAQAFLRLLLAFAPAQLPRTDNISLAGAPVGAAIGATMLAVLLFGAFPALMAARTDVAARLRLDSRSGSETRHRRRLRQSLVASQMALALVMLAAAGLLARSLDRLQRLNLGFTPDHLSVLQISWPGTRYGTSVPRAMAMGDEVAQHWRSLPGVTAVTPVLIPPFIGRNVWQWWFVPEGQVQIDADLNPPVPVEMGGAEFFRTFGIPILRGRGFLETDRVDAPLVVVVSEGVARRFWPTEDAIGKRIRVPIAGSGFYPRFGEWRTVVGVVGDTHFRSLRESAPMIYMPWQQSYWQGVFAVRTKDALGTVLPAMRRAMHAVDPGLVAWSARPMDELLGAPLATPRLSALLLSGFALAALVLAAIGQFGVMASAVREQTREIGVRMALGATPERMRRDVLRNALGVTAIGAAVGVVGALLSSRVYTSLLFEVSPTDPATIMGVCALLMAVGLGAAYLPARRATRIDPAQALRSE